MKRISQLSRLCLAITAFLVACISVRPTPAQAGDGPNFEIGGQVDVSQLGHLLLMKQLGMTWMKIQIVAEEGVPDISWIIRDWVRPNKLKLLVSLIGDRSSASSPAYANIYAAIAAGVARQGADAIEVWNEPNLGREWPGTNPYAYMNLLAKTYASIKKASPNTLVISAGVAAYADTRECGPDVCGSPLFFRGMQRAAAGLRKQAVPFADCIGVHYNIGTTPPAVLKGSIFSDKYTSYLPNVIASTSNFFHREIPLCFTELGYASGEGVGNLPDSFGWARGISVRNQADWLAQAATFLAQSGKVRLMVVWNADLASDDTGDPQAAYAIVRPDGSCPACQSLAAAMGKLMMK